VKRREKAAADDSCDIEVNELDEIDDELQRENEPAFVISVAARMVGMHAQTLRYYERVGLLKPSRSRGRIRLYSVADINRLRQIQRLISDLGVNLAGAEVIMRMNERIQELTEEVERLKAAVQRFRDLRLPAPGKE
jgi:MerR family transcriptional regulator/heat shock protein HspR